MATATGPTYVVPFKRRRRNITNYKKRLALVKSGVRLVVRKSSRNVLVQFADFSEKGDVVIASAFSKELEKHSWAPRANAPTAYLTGLLAGKRALEAGCKKAVLDIGLAEPSKGGVVFAALKGVLDSGVTVPHGEGIFDDSRIKGEHIAAFASSVKGTPKYDEEFSAYVKAGFAPEKIVESFERVKKEISG